MELKEKNPEELLKEVMTVTIPKIEADYQKQLGQKEVEINLLKEKLTETSPMDENKIQELGKHLADTALKLAHSLAQDKLTQKDTEKTSLKNTLTKQKKECETKIKQTEDKCKVEIKKKEKEIETLKKSLEEKDQENKKLVEQVKEALAEENNE